MIHFLCPIRIAGPRFCLAVSVAAVATLPQVGHALTWSLASGSASWPADKRTAIVNAMTEAVDIYNAHGHFNKHVTANYNAGVPTAQANYDGWIDFGGQIGTRTAMHEISHTLGVGVYWNWDPKVSAGKWIGTRALARVKLYNGASETIGADGNHFWPYGLNYDTEDGTTSRIRHVRVVAALRWDMGIVTDSDSDGMPDDWEQFWFGGTGQTGTADFDQDGSSNLAEYTADTDPTTNFSFTWKGGAGSWDTATANWTGAATLWRNGGNDSATFGGTAGTVTLATGITANAMVFNSNNYQLAGTTLVVTGTDPTVTTAAGVTATIAPVLGGSSGLIKKGPGTLVLSGANTFTGPLTVSGGMLAIPSGGRLYMNGGSGLTTIASGATLSFTGNWGWDGTLRYMGVAADENLIDGGTLQHTGTANPKTSAGAGRLFTIGAAGATLDSATEGQEFAIGYRYDYSDSLASNGGTLTLTGIGNGELNYKLPGTGTLIKSGTGTWRLTSAANTFSGGTTIQAGTLRVSNASSLGAGTVTLSGGTLNNTASLTLANAINAATGTTSEIDATVANFTLAGAVSGSGIIRNDSSTSASVVYQGSLSGFTGTFEHTNLNNGNNVFLNGTSVDSQNAAGAKIVLSGASNSNRAFTIGITGITSKVGELSGTGGRLGLGAGAAVEIGALNTSSTFAGVISGAGSLVKTGTGSLTLTGPNTFTGGMSVNRGVVSLTGIQDAANGGFALNITNATAATLNLGSTTQTATTTAAVASDKSVRIGSDGTAFTSTAAQTFTLDGTGGFPTILANAGTLLVGRASVFRVNANATWTQNGAMTIRGVGGYHASMSVSGGSFTYAGSEPIMLNPDPGNSANAVLTIAGGTFISSQGFVFGASTNTGTGQLILSGGGKLRLSANIAALASGAATGRFQLGSGGGEIDTNGFDATNGRPLTNVSGQTGSLFKTGNGTLSLTGTNTYTGPTTVAAGTLSIDGSLTTSAIGVSSSATLAGTGTTGAVTIASGGTLSPAGENPGTLATGTLTLSAGSTTRLQPGDLVHVNGNLSLGGTIDLAGWSAATAGSYPLFTRTGSLSGSAVLTPPAGFSAALDTSSPGVVALVLTANRFETWSRSGFSVTDLANPAISGPSATPAGDGLSNLLKYAFDLPPKVPAVIHTPVTRSGSNRLFTYTRPADRADLSYTVEVTNSLSQSSWTTSGVTHTRTATGATETWQASVPDSPELLFFRLRVTRP